MAAPNDARSRALLEELAAIDRLTEEISRQDPGSSPGHHSSVSRTYSPPAPPLPAPTRAPAPASTPGAAPAAASSSSSSSAVAGRVTFISPMYRPSSPSRAHLPASGGVVHSNLARAPRFRDEQQENPGVGAYHPSSSAFGGPAVVVPPSAVAGVHTYSAARAADTQRTVRTASQREVVRPLHRSAAASPNPSRSQSPTKSSLAHSGSGGGAGGPLHASGNAVQQQEHARAIEAVIVRPVLPGSGGGSSGSSSVGGGGAPGARPSVTLDEAARQRLEACGGDPLAALAAAIRRENELRRELGHLRDASYSAKLEAQGALSNLATQLDVERSALRRAEGARAGLHDRLRAAARAVEGAKASYEALLDGLRQAAQADAYGRAHPAVLSAIDAALRVGAALEEHCAAGSGAAGGSSGSGSGGGSGSGSSVSGGSSPQAGSAGSEAGGGAPASSAHEAARSPKLYNSMRGVEMPQRGADGEWRIRNMGSLAEQKAVYAPAGGTLAEQGVVRRDGLSGAWVDSGREGFKGMVELSKAKALALGVSEDRRASSPARNRPLTGAIAASAAGEAGATGPLGKLYSRADVAGFAASLVAAGGSSFVGSGARAPGGGGGGGGGGAPDAEVPASPASAAAAPLPAPPSVHERLRRLFTHYCVKGGSGSGGSGGVGGAAEFFNSPAVKRDWDLSHASLPKVVAVAGTVDPSSTLFLGGMQDLVREAGLLDSRLTPQSVSLSFARALEHGGGEGEGSAGSGSGSEGAAASAAQRETLARLSADPAMRPYLEMWRLGRPLERVKDAMARGGQSARTIALFHSAFEQRDPLAAAREEIGALRAEVGRGGGGAAAKRRLAALEQAFAAQRATSGLGFDKFVIAVTDVACRKYGLEGEAVEGGEGSGSGSGGGGGGGSGGLRVSPEAFRRVLHEYLLPLEERLSAAAAAAAAVRASSPSGRHREALPRSLALLPGHDIGAMAEAFSLEFVQPEVLAFFNAHTLAFKALFRDFSERAQHSGTAGSEGDRVTGKGLQNFADEYRLAPGAMGQKAGVKDVLVCAREVARWSSSSTEHIEAPSEIFLSFPEFLELLGLLSFAVALSHGWEASGGSVLAKIQALVRDTASLGAPWGKLAQGQKLLAACALAPQAQLF